MVKTRQLSNGIRLVTEEMTATRSVSVGVWVNAGSIFETEKEAGISHFIEHMLFKGTTRRDARAIAAEVDAIGGNINAFTAKECTCYYIKALDEDIATAVDLLSDILLNSTLEPENIEREKGVILEEIAMSLDNPEDVVFESAGELFYQNTALSGAILGTAASVRAFCREDLVDYMDRFYVAENMVIAAAGSVCEEELARLLEAAFANVRHGRHHGIPNYRTETEPNSVFVTKDTEQIHTCLVFPGAELGSDAYYALSILSNILGGSMSSRLFQSIREERGLAYSVYSYPISYRGTGCLHLYAGSGETQALEVLNLMLKEIDDLRKNGIREEEFHRCKQQFKGGILLGMETSSSHMNAIGKRMLLLDEEYDLDTIISRIECVTIEDVERMIECVFDSRHVVLAAAGRTAKMESTLKETFERWLSNDGGQTGTDL